MCGARPICVILAGVFVTVQPHSHARKISNSVTSCFWRCAQVLTLRRRARAQLMAAGREWAFSSAMQPKADELGYDLDIALDAMVLLRAEVPADAFTAGVLGTERSGYGDERKRKDDARLQQSRQPRCGDPSGGGDPLVTKLSGFSSASRMFQGNLLRVQRELCGRV